MKAEYLICYDIANPKRLGRVYRFMSGEGKHLQYSVFHCSLTWKELQAMKVRLSYLIDEEEDDIRIYPLPSGGKVIAMGCGDRLPEGVEIFME
ncbi:MAG: CRISPR-associated endonuclease Cas2 [Nitrospirae bacterium]|nr:CRISPR-associated endonuclease Cas2 [Nitrospirota bacterium]